MPKDSFKTRLESAKNKMYKRNFEENDEPVSNLGTAFKLSTELVAAVVVGTIIGFILDGWFGTKPWLILIFFFRRYDYWNNECNQICKEYAKINLEFIFYGNKSNAPIQSL